MSISKFSQHIHIMALAGKNAHSTGWEEGSLSLLIFLPKFSRTWARHEKSRLTELLPSYLDAKIPFLAFFIMSLVVWPSNCARCIR